MFAPKESELESLVKKWRDEIIAVCGRDGLLKEKVMKELTKSLGYKEPRLKRYVKLQVILNDNLINKLKTREKEIAEQIKEKPKVVSMDTNKARYLIETALMSFKCWRDERILHKKDIDALLKYNERTMTNQKILYRDKIYREGTTENKIYEELCSEIASYCMG